MSNRRTTSELDPPMDGFVFALAPSEQAIAARSDRVVRPVGVMALVGSLLARMAVGTPRTR